MWSCPLPGGALVRDTPAQLPGRRGLMGEGEQRYYREEQSERDGSRRPVHLIKSWRQAALLFTHLY